MSQRGALPLFVEAWRDKPVRKALGLVVEYATFAAGLGLAIALFATRVPMRMIDRALGLSLRERFVDLLARISPG